MHSVNKIKFILMILILFLILFMWCNKYNFMCDFIFHYFFGFPSSFLNPLNVIYFFHIGLDYDCWWWYMTHMWGLSYLCIITRFDLCSC